MDGDSRSTGAVSDAERSTYERDGFLVFDPGIEIAAIDRAVARLAPLYLAEGEKPDVSGRIVAQRDSRRIQDAWKIDADVKLIATAPRVLAVLRDLYGREPRPFQTLNFRVGSEQRT